MRYDSENIALFHRPLLLLVLLLLGAMPGNAGAQPAAIRLRVIGGLADVGQYTRHEVPFWTSTVPALTEGRVQAEIAPFDRSGIRGPDLLRLLRLGVVAYANVLLGQAAADDPELDALNLPLVNPDMAALRRNVALLRPHLANLLRQRYGVELLAIYVYPAQVMLCRGAFAGLGDLAGRRVRTSSVAQSELMTQLGARPVVIPFAEIVPAMRDGVVQCAITGAMSAVEIGLPAVATHLSAVPVNWGVSVFAANGAAWSALPNDIRASLREGLLRLQEDIWQAAERDEAAGVACATGRAECPPERRGSMQLVVEPTMDTVRQRLLRAVVIPGWIRRCGPPCTVSWNSTLGPGLNVRAEGE